MKAFLFAVDWLQFRELIAAVQFWHGFGGGLYVAWYVPLALLVMFRPNVAGRVATTEVRERRRKVAEAT